MQWSSRRTRSAGSFAVVRAALVRTMWAPALMLAAPALAAPAAAGTGGTGTGEFETALWPGEGRPVLEAGSDELPLRETPHWSSCPAIVTVERGRRLAFEDTRYRTLRPGGMVALRGARVRGRDLGRITELSRQDYYRRVPAVTVAVEAGQVVALLQRRAEGTCFVRLGGRVVEAEPCPDIDRSAFQLSPPPVVEWWVRVRLGDQVGWTLVDGENLLVVDRTFR